MKVKGPYKVHDRYQITGRGMVAVISRRELEEMPGTHNVITRGDIVEFTNHDGEPIEELAGPHRVNGLEMSRYMTSPPRYADPIGLVVQPAVPEDATRSVET